MTFHLHQVKNWRSYISTFLIRLRHAKSQYFTLFYPFSTACIQKRTSRGKSKAIPVQAYYRHVWFQEVEAPRFLYNRHRPPLPPTLLEAESTPGPQCGQKDYVNEKFQWNYLRSNPACSAVPQPTAWATRNPYSPDTHFITVLPFRCRRIKLPLKIFKP